MKRTAYSPSLWGQSSSEAFCAAVIDFVQRYGSASDILLRMEHLGLGAIARSWVQNDLHVPLFSAQLHALFGTSALRAFAARVDLQPRDLVRRLSQTLPPIVHHLATSQGVALSVALHINSIV
jgi:uncharacterized protein YidB (DUF937 family)